MPDPLPPSAQKVQEALRQAGFTGEVLEVPHSTRTAAEAAAVVGCEVAQIVKSLVFRLAHSDRPVLVIASGANRVNEKRVGELVGEPLAKAGAEFVRQHTGYAIGGVPPLGHIAPIDTYIDEDLLGHAEVWAAAGTPNTLFRLAPADLVRLTGGRVIKVQ
jgi:prolyl-tRNA editing enzyme YbaK/EbsC (Cys-tRNA(Pro) deacylase)